MRSPRFADAVGFVNYGHSTVATEACSVIGFVGGGCIHACSKGEMLQILDDLVKFDVARVPRGKYYRWYNFLEEITERYKKRGGREIS